MVRGSYNWENSLSRPVKPWQSLAPIAVADHVRMAELSGLVTEDHEDTLLGVRAHFKFFFIFFLQTTIRRSGTVSELPLISPLPRLVQAEAR
jgi:hypothetical protein